MHRLATRQCPCPGRRELRPSDPIGNVGELGLSDCQAGLFALPALLTRRAGQARPGQTFVVAKTTDDDGWSVHRDEGHAASVTA